VTDHPQPAEQHPPDGSAAAPFPTPPLASAAPNDGGSQPGAVAVADRPEVAVGAAFAGGFALALILKRLAR
jgi:hypothetical protein